MGTNTKLQLVKLNTNLDLLTTKKAESLLWKYKDVFAWSYKDLKGIPPYIAQHQIDLDITIPPSH
jgi:hypothetical protein